MNPEFIDRIKRIAIISLVSDDILLNKLVLKGGSAINVIHKISSRSSIDIDYSIAGDFEVDEMKTIEERISKVLHENFKENGFRIFDFKFYEQPEKIDARVKHFWGGYVVEFKIIESEKFEKLKDIDSIRRNALQVGKKNSTKFTIDISKYEYVDKKADYDFNGYTLYAYTPAMIICEKLRAICQQIPEYKTIVKTITSKPRARDFYDIYELFNKFKIDLSEKENIILLKDIFESKHTPIEFLLKIDESKDLHSDGFNAVIDTVENSKDLKDFDFYFAFVKKVIEEVYPKIASL